MEKFKVKCNKCEMEEEFEHCDMGLNFFQAHGQCLCGGEFCYEDGTPTKEYIEFRTTKN